MAIAENLWIVYLQSVTNIPALFCQNWDIIVSVY